MLQKVRHLCDELIDPETVEGVLDVARHVLIGSICILASAFLALSDRFAGLVGKQPAP